MTSSGIDKETVKRLAELARIEISPEEEISMAKDLESILGYVSELSNVAGVSREMVLDDNINNFREDENPDGRGIYTEKILAEVPRQEKGYILVKQVIGEKGR